MICSASNAVVGTMNVNVKTTAVAVDGSLAPCSTWAPDFGRVLKEYPVFVDGLYGQWGDMPYLAGEETYRRCSAYSPTPPTISTIVSLVTIPVPWAVGHRPNCGTADVLSAGATATIYPVSGADAGLPTGSTAIVYLRSGTATSRTTGSIAAVRLLPPSQQFKRAKTVEQRLH